MNAINSDKTFTDAAGRESRELSARVRALETALSELKETVEYGFEHIDESNLSAETVEKLSLGDSAQTGTVTVGQFAANLRLTLRGRDLSLGSGGIPLNTVRLPYTGIRDYEATDACWPVGSVYLTAGELPPEDTLGVGVWQELTAPEGLDCACYERVE